MYGYEKGKLNKNVRLNKVNNKKYNNTVLSEHCVIDML